MVKETHPINMVRFLFSLTDGLGIGKGPERLQHVDVIRTRAFRLTSRGREGGANGQEAGDAVAVVGGDVPGTTCSLGPVHFLE